MTKIIDTQINTITEMLEEFKERVDKCDSNNILSFAKTIGENLGYTTEMIRRSSLNVIEKVKMSQDIERLEHEFGNINDNFSKCKCNR